MSFTEPESYNLLKQELIEQGVEERFIYCCFVELEEIFKAASQREYLEDYFQAECFDTEPDYNYYSVQYRPLSVRNPQTSNALIAVAVWIEDTTAFNS